MFTGLDRGPDHDEPWPWTQTDNVINDFESLQPFFQTLSKIGDDSDLKDNKIYTLQNNRCDVPELQAWMYNAEQSVLNIAGRVTAKVGSSVTIKKFTIPLATP